MRFEWDRTKAEANLKKHRVSFDEAVTVFYDPLAATFAEPDHSQVEDRLVPAGYSAKADFLLCAMLNEAEPYAWSARAVLRLERGSVMKAKSRAQPDDMRSDYDFDYSAAVRGKYYRRLLKESSNVVVLKPDVAKAFRSSAAVNEALRTLLRMSQATRRLTSRSSGRATCARR